MEIKEQVKLKFHGVEFPSISLNSTQPFVHGDGNNIDIKINPQVFYPKNKVNHFNIVMNIELSAENFFNLQFLSIGTFEIDGNIDGIIKKNFVNINAPAIMFPYVRSFITTLTSNIGNVTTPLIIPSQFFQGELLELDEEN